MRKLKKLDKITEHTGTGIITTYKEIQPLETDPETGEILNLSLKKKIVPNGTEDIQARIQSHEEEADIKTLIARLNAGDKTIGQKDGGQYIDLTNLPNDYHALIKASKALNEKLATFEPKEERKEGKENEPSRIEQVHEEHSSDTQE